METASPLVLARDRDTICALATATGPGAIAVIRVSGPQAFELTRRLAPFLPVGAESHRIYYGLVRDLEGGLELDEVLISVFHSGRSFTGEPTTEISCHGSPNIVAEILRQLVLAGARPADRGEFTYRAFMHGRIDLVQAESVLALVESHSMRAGRLALRQLKGEFSQALGPIRETLTWVLAQLEANIDFAAEDIVIAADDELGLRLDQARTSTSRLLKGYDRGRVLRHGCQVALVGRPNAGKSSLLNALVREERAIVTPIEGTTRDFVEAHLNVGGASVTLVDTAGLRQSEDPIERIGIERTLAKLAEVDLIFYVVDASISVADDEVAFHAQIPWDKTVVLFNKIDLCPSAPTHYASAPACLPVSAVSRGGLDRVEAWLETYLGTQSDEDSTLVSSVRQFEGLKKLERAIGQAQLALKDTGSPDLVALELQEGLRSIYELLGLVYDDQVMDQVFAQFCLGK